MAGTCTSKMETSFAHLARMLARFTQGIDEQMREALRQLPPHIAISSDSLADRMYQNRMGKKPLKIQDRGYLTEGEWYPTKTILFEDDLRWVKFVSNTSGSSIEGVLKKNSRWTVTLTVPIQEDGVPYKGAYWHEFWGDAPTCQEDEQEEVVGEFWTYVPPTHVKEVAPPPPEEPPAPIARVEEDDEEV